MEHQNQNLPVPPSHADTPPTPPVSPVGPPPQQPMSPPAPMQSPVSAPPAPPTFQQPPAPVQTPVAASAPQFAAAGAAPAENSAGIIIMQWLTYAFWGWTVLALSVLTTTVLSSIIAGADTGGFTPYGIAAVLVLLPIAVICDKIYSKHEPDRKTGAASIVMVIHAVIFALIGIGCLIWAVFNIVTLFTESTDHPAVKVSLYSTLIVTVFYAATFVRTLSPVRFRWIRRAYLMFMVGLVGLIALAGILGPMAVARQTKDDKLIERNLSSLSSNINTYARTNDKLPENLGALTLTGDTKQMVDKNLVRYTANTNQSSSSGQYNSTSTTTRSTSLSRLSTSKTYYYSLCATFKKQSANYETYGKRYSDTSRYTSSPSAYYHPAGEVCYKIQTTDYGYDY